MFLSILTQEKKSRLHIWRHVKQTGNIFIKMLTDYLWAVEQLMGEFVFLIVPFQTSYNKYGIFKNLVYPPVLILAIRDFSGHG